MDFRDLHIFCSVVRAGGVTRAAEQLHRVPSNVTTRIRQMEEDLGVPLFLRDGKRMRMTPAGQVLHGYAQQILTLGREAREAVLDGAPRGRLSLGSMESTAAIRLPQPLAEFHRRYPEVTLELSTGPSSPLVSQVLDGALDAAFVADPPRDARLESLPVFVEELVLVTADGQPRIRSPQDVSSPTLLVFAQGCAYRRRLEAWFEAGGCAPARVVELASYHAILGCAVAGMGVALLPRSLLEQAPGRDRLGVHPLPAALRHAQTLLIWRQGGRSAALDAWTGLLQAPA